jgi:uncharacterized membrane protein
MSILYWLMGLGAPGDIRKVDSLFWYAAHPIPIWLIVLIALVGLAAAVVNLLPQNIMPVRTRIGLLFARLLGFAILLLLVTQIEVRLNVHRDVKPRIAVLVDTSGSMGLHDVNGQTRLEAARAFVKSKLDALAEAKKVDIASIDFSWQLHTPDRIAAASQPSGIPSTAPASQPAAYDRDTPAGMTRLIGSIQEAVQRERDLQDIIVLTDGNDTVGDQGTLLATMLAGRKLPVFPVVFGEAAEPKMASVKISSATPYVRLGDEFRLNVALSATNLGEQIVGVHVYESGNLKQAIATRENVRIGKEPANIAFSIKPRSVGLKTYRVTMDGVRGSVTTQTHVAEQTVEVIKSQVKILYLDIPRDESKIIGQFLAHDPIVDLARLTLLPKGGWYAQGVMQHTNAGDGLPNKEEDLYKYDIIIMGDIPRAYFRAGGDIAESKMQRLVEFVTRRGGGLITLGGRDVYAAGQYDDSALARILPFDISATKEPQVAKPFKIAPTAAGYAHPLMLLESDAATNREAWLDLPSLDGNNFVGNVKPGASLLAVRNLDGGGTMPIIAVQPVGKGQVLSLSTDTTWRWEMMRPDEGEDYYRRFWGNAIRTLAPDPRLAPNRPQITRYETNTPVGTTITLSTRLVDPVFQPLRNADLDVLVTSPSGKVTHIYPHDGRESPGLYEYQVTLDEAGAWEVVAKYKDQVSQEHIVAGESNEELDDVRAKPQAMETFAKATGGQSFAPDQGEQLLARLDLTPRTSSQTTTVAIWDLPAVMTLFIAILCIDCLVRKRRGMV